MKKRTVADAIAGDQNALGVHAVRMYWNPLPLLADQVPDRDFQVVEEQLVVAW